MRRLLIIILCAALFITGCAGTIYDGDTPADISFADQIRFLLNAGSDVGENMPAQDSRDPRQRIAAMRELLAGDPELGESARQAVTQLLDLMETALDDEEQLAWDVIFNNIDFLLRSDRTRREQNKEATNYVLTAVGDALLRERMELARLYDNVVRLTETLHDRFRAHQITYTEWQQMPNFDCTDTYDDADKARAAELEYTLRWRFTDAGSWGQRHTSRAQVVSYNIMRLGVLALPGLGYQRNTSRRWMHALHDTIFHTQIPNTINEIEAEVNKLRDRLPRTMELLALYNFLNDKGNCHIHHDGFHFAEGHYAFKGRNIEAMQEDLMNKLASYGGGGLVRYEDDNILNMLMHSDFDPQTYERIFFLHGLRETDERLIENDRARNGDQVTNDRLYDLRIARSGALLLPPVFMFDPGYKGPLTHIDGGQWGSWPNWKRDFSDKFSQWSSLTSIENFHAGAGATRNRFGEVVGGQRIMDFYRGPGDRGRIRYHSDRFLTPQLTFSQFLDVKFEGHQDRPRVASGLNTLCRVHLTSFHTIVPELEAYIRENGGSLNEFRSSHSGCAFNIRNFVRFYNIPREDFEALFNDGRWFQPYNTDAVYSSSGEAVYYFDLRVKSGYAVSYSMNGVPGTPPVQRMIPPGRPYTIADAPDAPHRGLAFIEWNTHADGRGTGFAPLTAAVMDPPRTQTYFAQWQRIPFTLTFDMNDGTDRPPLEEERYAADNFLMPGVDDVVPPPGFKLNSWNTEPDGTGWIFRPGDVWQMPIDDLTLYAQWEEITFEVIYNLNGAAAGTAPLELPKRYAERFAARGIAASVTAPQHHRFAGWNTEPDGSGETYRAGDVIEMPDHALTLYAVWEMIAFTVTYDLNGAWWGHTPPGTTQRLMPGTTITLPAAPNWFRPPLARNGSLPDGDYFIEWNTAPDGSGESFAGGAQFTIRDYDVTMYAIARTFYVVWFNRGTIPSGAPPQHAFTVEAGGTLVLQGQGTMDPRDPSTRFLGWMRTNSLPFMFSPPDEVPHYKEGDVITVDEDMELFAYWSRAQ